MANELRRVEIQNGKICLEGKVVDADLIGLDVLKAKNYPGNLGGSKQESSEVSSTDLYCPPEEANAYCVGARCGWEFPILYLRIKNQ